MNLLNVEFNIENWELTSGYRAVRQFPAVCALLNLWEDCNVYFDDWDTYCRLTLFWYSHTYKIFNCFKTSKDPKQIHRVNFYVGFITEGCLGVSHQKPTEGHQNSSCTCTLIDLCTVLCMIIRNETLKNKESPKDSETTTFKFPSRYIGFKLHFHMVFFLLDL